MPCTLTDDELPCHLPSSEIPRPKPAKADLRKAEMDADLRKDEAEMLWRIQVGKAFIRAMSLCGWTLGDVSRELDKDPRQLARWCNGLERAQFDVLFANETLRLPLLRALAEQFGGADIEIEEVIHIKQRRRA